jgi:hypothetical protein
MLTGKQATTVAQLHELPWHEPTLEVESILMVDLATAQAQAKGAALSANCEEGQTKDAVAKPLNAPLPPSADGVDMLYHQLAEIHAITATQLVECARWRPSDPTSSPVHARASWQRPNVEPSAARMAPPPPTNFSPQASLWQWGQCIEPQVCRQTHQGDLVTQPKRRVLNPRQGEHRGATPRGQG